LLSETKLQWVLKYLEMTILRWIVLSHSMYRENNYCLSLYLNIAGIQQS